jgi:acyl transferase domain-containing protein/thioesterase domain-containing protein
MSSENGKIAVIGMACRFPGANNIDEYWANLLKGKETIKLFKDEELQDYEIDYDKLKKNPNFVPARGVLENIDEFDAHFFGISPPEATLTDPQHRIWLETVWAAFENAGCNPYDDKGNIGVYAGGYVNTYLLNNVLRDPLRYENYIRLRTTESFQITTSNDISHLPTKTAYQFNLKGPAVNVQTACSTSLVAIAQACNSLYSFESDVCIAGGVCILTPQESGYIYQEGAIPSPDGHCRPFDAKGQGTVFSNGVGVVVLKRIEDAIKDKDHIYAVVDGWALNNDGNKKVSYTAPSVQGQEEVILMAQSFAGIKAEDMGYIEAHGTATNLGDPIEMKALSNAFSRTTSEKQFCGIGSVKSNIGHTDAAAGVASFIKICLAAHHKTIPPTINYETPNPYINFNDSPFYVNDKLNKWTSDKKLVIGVSSFGIGGTNAHLIIEEPPQVKSKDTITAIEKTFVLPLSAKSKTSLIKRKSQLQEYLSENKEISLYDVNHSLWQGRSHMVYRSATIADSVRNIVEGNIEVVEGKAIENISAYTFMFPGQGAQFTLMGKSLYEENKAFKTIVDHGFSLFKEETGVSLEELVFPSLASKDAEKELTKTIYTQAALFIFEFALAKVLIDDGITPKYLIGHSIGEFTAAALAGVFDFETALKVVIKRGQLMQSMPSGTMFAVKSSYQDLAIIKNNLFEIAAENAPESCTISFKTNDTEQVKNVLGQADIRFIPLNTSHAFHSEAFDPILEEFAAFIETCTTHAPQIPFISCCSGDFISDDEAMSGEYWAKQLRNTVLFSKGISAIQSIENTLFIEVGPNSHLSSNVKASSVNIEQKTSILTLGRPGTNPSNIIKRIKANIWCCTSKQFIDFETGSADAKKIPLPTYPFDKKRYWINHKYENGLNAIADSNTEQTKEMESHDDIANLLLTIWKKRFGRDDITLTDNFNDLGGESMLAFSLISDIEKHLHINIPFRDFIGNYNTINKVLAFVKDKIELDEKKTTSKNKFNHLYCLQPKGDATPVFNIFGEKVFSDEDEIISRPIYAFAWPGSDGRSFEMNSVEEIALAYLSQIQKTNPNGPYYLMGFSFGGLVAMEIALELQKRGLQTPVLLLLDSSNPNEKVNNIKRYKSTLNEHGVLKTITRWIFTSLPRHINDSIQKIRIYFLLKSKRRLPADLTNRMILNKADKIASRYHPGFFNGKIHLFKVKENTIKDEFLGWKENAAQIEKYDLEGKHLDVIDVKNNKSNIIKKLKEIIAEVEN